MSKITDSSNYQHLKEFTGDVQQLSRNKEVYLKIAGKGNERHVVVVQGKFSNFCASLGSYFGFKSYDLSAISELLQRQLAQVDTDFTKDSDLNQKEVVEVTKTCRSLSKFLVSALGRKDRIVANREKHPEKNQEIVKKTNESVKSIFDKKKELLHTLKDRQISEPVEDVSAIWQTFFTTDEAPDNLYIALFENREFLHHILGIDFVRTYKDSSHEVTISKVTQAVECFLKENLTVLESVGSTWLTNGPYKKEQTVARQSYLALKAELEKVLADLSSSSIEELIDLLRDAEALLLVNECMHVTDDTVAVQAEKRVICLELKVLSKTPKSMKKSDLAEAVSQVEHDAHKKELEARLQKIPDDRVSTDTPHDQKESVTDAELLEHLLTALSKVKSETFIGNCLLDAFSDSLPVHSEIENLISSLKDPEIDTHRKELMKVRAALDKLNIEGLENRFYVEKFSSDIGKEVLRKIVNDLDLYESLTQAPPKTAQDRLAWIKKLERFLEAEMKCQRILEAAGGTASRIKALDQKEFMLELYKQSEKSAQDIEKKKQEIESLYTEILKEYRTKKESYDSKSLLYHVCERIDIKDERFLWEIGMLCQAEGLDRATKDEISVAKKAVVLLELREVLLLAKEKVREGKKTAAAKEEKKFFIDMEKKIEKLSMEIAGSDSIEALVPFSKERLINIDRDELQELHKKLFDTLQPLAYSPNIDTERKWKDLPRFRRACKSSL